MSYANKTFQDPNPVKRYLQKSRLKDALGMCGGGPGAGVIVDFGAGNGELCSRLSGKFPDSRIFCYDPHPELLGEARDRLEAYDNITFTNDVNELPQGSAELVFALEVFEHLPEPEFGQAIDRLEQILAVDGIAVIGVPVETGLPAFYKGVFRMYRRHGEFDARFKHIITAVFGYPGPERPVVEILPGCGYHLHHLGFDHRTFRDIISDRFQILRTSASPFPLLGTMANPEVYFVLKKRVPDTV